MLRLLVIATLLTACASWTTGSSVSSFGGNVLLQRISTQSSGMTMKKGKSNVPTQMRGQYEKMKEMQAQREAMEAAGKPSDGLPVFNLFVRTKRANVSSRLERV
jgi:hypothetical protein